MKTRRSPRSHPLCPMAAACRHRHGPGRLALTVAVLAFVGRPTASRADLTLSLQPAVVMATPGGAGGTFEVWISNTSPTASFELAGFSIELSLEQTVTDVTFTDVTKGPFSIPAAGSSAPPPYVFSTPGPPPFSFDVFPNQIFIASDAVDASGSRTIAAGETYGLALVSFDPGAHSGTALVRFGFTSLSDPDSNSIDDYTTMDNTIVVAPPAAVPEPSTLVLVIGLGFPLLAYLRRVRGGLGIAASEQLVWGRLNSFLRRSSRNNGPFTDGSFPVLPIDRELVEGGPPPAGSESAANHERSVGKEKSVPGVQPSGCPPLSRASSATWRSPSTARGA